MTNRENIIRKIKKCLALSASSNEHEAAAALRQAQKLMEQFNISDLDVQASEVGEKRARAGAIKSPANWESGLASRVADAMGCQIVFRRNYLKGYGEWSFIGSGVMPEVADYAFKVLFRQCKAARAEHIKARLKRCKHATKTRRADLYCEGWVLSVAGKINAFAGNDTNKAAVEAYMATHYPTLSDLKSRDRNEGRNLRDHEYDDVVAGQRAGRDAQLNRGVGGAEERKALQ